MNGFQQYIPASSSLKRLKLPGLLIKNSQKGSGRSNAVKIVSPSEQIVDQAKESLKRNKQEQKQQGGGASVITKGSSPSTEPLIKKARITKKENPRSKGKITKLQKIHKRYKKKAKSKKNKK